MLLFNGDLTELKELFIYLLIILAATFLVLLFMLRRRRVRETKVCKTLKDFSINNALSVAECEEKVKELAKTNMPNSIRNYNFELRSLVKDTERKIRAIRAQLESAPSYIISMVPAARWLFDNFYIIYREVKKDEKNISVYRNVPIIKKGKFKGYPRVFLLVKEIVSELGFHLTESYINKMIDAYQEITPLTSAELVLIPDLMGLCLVEGILNASNEILEVVRIKSAADRHVQKVIGELKAEEDVSEKIGSGIDRQYFDNISYISHILYSLKRVAIDEMKLNEYAKRLSVDQDKELNTSAVFLKERTFETKLESSMRSKVESIKLINKVNKAKFFDRHSPIEKYLKQDPARVYKKMDDESRSLYRWNVEKLAAKHKMDEWKAAKKTLELAERNLKRADMLNPGHVGTYLVGRAKNMLNAYLTDSDEIPPEKKGKTKNVLYFVCIGIFTLMFMVGVVWIELYRYNFLHVYFLLFTLFTFFPVMGIAIELTNYLFNNLIEPVRLPALDFKKKIPAAHRTIVAMPVIFSNEEQVNECIDKLEKYYLANPQPNLFFSILGDFKDAKERVMPGDQEILDAALEGMEKLNSKYPGRSKRFAFFIRYRKWNEKEGCFMGWERKRGKLEEFNALLLGEENTSFMQVDGNGISKLDIKYVITIDADTDLIRGSAAKLAGIIAHPLNRPVINCKTKKVERGYVIVQSQLRTHVGFTTRSVFSKVFSGQPGIDAYSTVVSDVYQDTFESGTFLGKGIYDIKAMHQLLYNTLPENTVLSHDLLESCYAKCAFAGNVELMDTHPSNVLAFSKREHRWIRGDWQLIPWLFGKDSLGGLSRWKIFDNMRRSLIPYLRFSVIVINAFLLPESFYVWIPIVFFGEFLRILHIIAKTITERIRQPMSRVAARNFLTALYIVLEQAALRFVLLPYRSWVALDAIFRTLFRLIVSKKGLLEWETAEIAERKTKNRLGSYLKLWFSAVPAGALLVLAAYIATSNILEKFEYLLIAGVWLLSPFFSYAISIVTKQRTDKIPKHHGIRFMRDVGRKTWQYFRRFCTERNNYLCPDNYQVFPNEKESPKTSPTNIGLQLMAFVSARDLGYIGILSLTDYIAKTMAAIDKLEKWNGHLYNWYNTHTLERLFPHYVSTVDSGNYIGYLITVKNAFLSYIKSPAVDETMIQGIRDTLLIARIDFSMPDEFMTAGEFENCIKELVEKIQTNERKEWEDKYWIGELLVQCTEILNDFSLIEDKEVRFDELPTLEESALAGNGKAVALKDAMMAIVSQIDNIVNECNFKALFDKSQMFYYIGYNDSARSYDASYYDLIASEAMLTSFIGIAKNEIPREHWLKLGRPLTMSGGYPAFVSWSGTMFEYLMPYLVMSEFNGSVYSLTARAAVREQIAYGKAMNIPWGISESQYYRFDVASNYQYRAFGIPKLSQQPQLDKSIVVAPYATFLAMQFNMKKAVKNLIRLMEMRVYGDYGFYEAVDYNSPDTESMEDYSIVKCYMAHHQGMSLVSLNNVINNNIMRKRFHSEPIIKSAEVILEEVRTAYVVPISREGYAIAAKQPLKQAAKGEYRFVLRTSPEIPRTLWLSNNRYSMLLTSDGDGFSKRKDIMVNRWTSDIDSFSGQYVFIKETESGKYWSAAFKPALKEPDDYKVVFSSKKAEFNRKDGDISTMMEVTLSPFKDIEFRKVTITNHSSKLLKIETTSYLEVVLDKFQSGLYHPAFNKLFIESEMLNDSSVLICKRRSGKKEEGKILFHMMKTDAHEFNDMEYETDRQKFLGRNNTLVTPDAIANDIRLSNNAEFSIDPIMSIRAKIDIPSGKSATVTYITGICDSADEARQISRDYGSQYSIDEAFNQFERNSDLETKYLDLTEKKINVIQDLIGPVFYPSKHYRADEKPMMANRRGQDALWQFGISGDNPIILYKIKSMAELNVARDILKAYEYMRINEINVDLVILDEEAAGYFQDVRAMLAGMLASLRVYVESSDKPSLFIVNSSQISDEDRNLLLSSARIVFNEDTGIYFRNVEREIGWRRFKANGASDKRPLGEIEMREQIPAKPNLEFYNGYGGFASGGREYEIMVDDRVKTPMPWVNVIANDQFGFIVSETGGGYTWAHNSSENKLTSWANDPVSDPKSELLYIKDAKSGRVSCAFRCADTRQGMYRVRHGFGYSTFTHKGMNVNQTLCIFVPEKDPVKIWMLELENQSEEQKLLYVTLHLKLEMGRNREFTSQYINTYFEKENECFYAQNTYSNTYRSYRAFAFSNEKIFSYTGDRKEFLDKSTAYDAGFTKNYNYSNTAGAGYDPCITLQVSADLAPGEKKKIVFGMGYAKGKKTIDDIRKSYSTWELADKALKNVKEYWKEITETITVTTQDRALTFLQTDGSYIRHIHAG